MSAGDTAAIGPQRRLEADFAEAERNGLMLAAQVRIAALIAIMTWNAIDNPAEGLDYLLNLGQVGIFAVLGVVQYLCARFRLYLDVLKYVFVAVDCALLAVVLMLPDPFDAYRIPPAITMNSAPFLYFFLILIQSAFSFRPALMLWCGFCIALARTGMLLFQLGKPGVYTNLDLADRSTEALVAARADPNFLFLGFWAIEILMSLILAAGLATLVRRSRHLVERRALAERARASLARYFSPNVVDRLSGETGVLEDVREQNVAVLFTDIMGFTKLCEASPPREVIELLRSYHDRLGRAVFENGGTLDKYIGDGLMATFGTPEAAQDDAARALKCAFDMNDALAAWNQERAETGQAPVRVGIGLHYGPVISGDIGNARRLEYSVIGDTVNIASRLEHLTRDLGATIVVSDALVQAIPRGDAVSARLARLRPAGRQQVRGRDAGVAVWVLDPAT